MSRGTTEGPQIFEGPRGLKRAPEGSERAPEGDLAPEGYEGPKN